ncbi:MAG TPA: 2-C-methyl-D-erythritol 4-phosphate cytidylyltransferase [Gammaproteobacteria bacterium]|nr:2-C-methyl-D-erythritol 4-phosphate cytidylyltransferase [Gammaproteobacteria bacterium]HIK69027.1 2-C-methyl-D-erythritol 4-phosphate cytidylyltransferase [Pseudomonadales bacterium]
MSLLDQFTCIIPAAGLGLRMGAEVPKQYLSVGGKAILQLTLDNLAAHQPREIIVALNAADRYFSELTFDYPLRTVMGGKQRSQSVLSALQTVNAGEDSFVLVHDGVRPCLRVEDIQALIAAVDGHPVGGCLGVPIKETVKQAKDEHIVGTLDRSQLWLAQTPQIFRFGMLRQALTQFPDATDEASAIEMLGFQPKLVQGHSDNIKITTSEDLVMAQAILKSRRTP